MNTHTTLILKLLIKDNKIDTYNLYILHRLSPAQILDSVKILSEYKLIKFTGYEIIRNKNFFEILFRLRFKLFRNRQWLEAYSKPDLAPFSQDYVPSKKLMSIDYLKSIMQADKNQS